MMGQIWRRLQLLAAQGVATLVSAKEVQAQVLDAEVLKTQRVEPYGFSYRPKPGAQVYLVFPGGDRALGLALVVGDKRYQMDLAEGEVALHDDEGNHVHLGRGGRIAVKASSSVTLDAPDVLVTGRLTVMEATTLAQSLAVGGPAAMAAGMAVAGALTNNGSNVGANHVHSGVEPGLGVTGVPQ